MSIQEEWRPIPEWGGSYEASDMGRTRSLPRTITDKNGWKRRIRGCILKESIDRYGYPSVTLGEGGRQSKFGVHRLVLMAFLGAPPPGHEGCHEDGNPANNRLSNLRWDTRGSNVADKIKHGAAARLSGERRGGPKLTEFDVLETRRRVASGDRICDIASSYGVSRRAIIDIKNGRTWAWLTEGAP